MDSVVCLGDLRLFVFHSKGLKTDKLPNQVFEIDEDAKDEVSGVDWSLQMSGPVRLMHG